MKIQSCEGRSDTVPHFGLDIEAVCYDCSRNSVVVRQGGCAAAGGVMLPYFCAFSQDGSACEGSSREIADNYCPVLSKKSNHVEI